MLGKDRKAHRRLMWRNGTNGNRGSLQSLFETYASDEYKQLQDYAFDAYVVDDMMFVAVTAARVFEDGFPKRNTKDETNQFVYLTALAQVNGDSRQEANLTTTLPISALVPDSEAHSSAYVNITAIGRDENACANNAFQVFLGGGNPLHVHARCGEPRRGNPSQVRGRARLLDQFPVDLD